MNRIAAALGAALVLVFLLGGGYLVHQAKQIAALKAENGRLSAQIVKDREAYQASQKTAQSGRKRAEEARKKADTPEVREWREQELPKSIQEALE